MEKSTDGAINWLGIAIRRHERHMAGEEPTTGEDGDISQKLMMEEMKYAMADLKVTDSTPTNWYQDNIGKFPDKESNMKAQNSSGILKALRKISEKIVE